MGLDRWVAFVAIEALAWLYFTNRRSEGSELEQRYRDLAWSVARRGYEGPRLDGDFDYYESLGKYAASGAYDADPEREGVQPERAAGTYNAVVWDLARALFFGGAADTLPEAAPEYRAALEYYRAHAVRDEFAWSWTGAPQEQARYRELMEGSDDARRAATRALGLILANHLVSAVDAMISARLGGAQNPGSSIQLQTTMTLRGGEPSWNAEVRVPWPGR